MTQIGCSESSLGRPTFRARCLRALGLLLVVLMLSSCGEIPVAQSISQMQANEIVALLNRNGIYATSDKQVGVGDKYDVQVKRSHYAQAIELLHSRGLPGKPKERFSDLIAQKGLIPDSREVESLRLDHALGVQLQEMLDNLPSIVSSKVIVRVNFLQEDTLPSASIVVQVRKGHDLDQQTIIDLIAKTVPGLEPEHIHFSPHDVTETSGPVSREGVMNEEGEVVHVPLTSFLFGWRVPEEDYNGLALSLVAFVLVIGFVGGVVGYWYGYIQQEPEGGFETGLSDFRSGALRLDSQKLQRTLPEE